MSTSRPDPRHPTRRTVGAVAAGAAALATGLVALSSFSASAVEEGESTFVPIDPCRLFDTRAASQIGPQGAIGPDDTATFQVTGTNGTCTIPESATAVSINISAAVATEQTNVRVYPADEPLTETAVLNPRPDDIPTSNKVDVELSADGRINVYNRFGGVDLVGDVLGYYRADGLQALEASQPFSLMATDETAVVGDAPQVIAAMPVNAIVAGQMTVTVSANVVDPDAGEATRCSITTGTALEDGVHRTVWESPGSDGDRAIMSSTRMISVPAGASTINFVCDHEGAGTAEVTQTVMTGIFTPDR